MKRLSILLFSSALALLSAGCYTQFKLVDQTPPPPAQQEEWVVDSATGDTVKVIKQTDTIREENSKTCVWERDLLGYPTLRCYDSFYPRDWFWYNNSPWWYRNDPYWYDYNRCPRYYYYDLSCGCCRYSGTSDYYHDRPGRSYQGEGGSGASKSEPAIPGGSTIAPRVRGVPDPRGSKAVPSSSSGGSTSQQSKSASVSDSGRQSGQLIINAEEPKQPQIVRQRSVGVPSQRSAAPAPSSSQPSGGTTASVPSSPPPQTPAPAQNSGSTRQGDSSSSNSNQQQQDSQQHKRHNPRSW